VFAKEVDVKDALFDRLVGVWTLIAAEFAEHGGERSYPLGKDPVGLLIYSSCGRMAVQVMKRERDKFGSGDQFNASDAEVKTAFEGYAAYFGRFTVDELECSVTHHVEGSLFPNWERGIQKRFVKLAGNELTLKSPPLQVAAKLITGRLTWQRVSDGSATT
jgi:hypothetical protein